jgi:hypothetical protein
MLHLHRKKAFGYTRRKGWLKTGSFFLLVLSVLRKHCWPSRGPEPYDHDSKPYYFGITFGSIFPVFKPIFIRVSWLTTVSI